MSAELPAFLIPHLDRIARDERFETGYQLQLEAGSKHGDGFMSYMLAVTISGTRRPKAGDGGVESDAIGPGQLPLICKMLPASALRREHYDCKVIFEREALVYSTIMPMLAEFQRANGIGRSTGIGFHAYPRCYVAVADPATEEYCIVMDNLRTIGYEMWDRQRRMPVEMARLVMHQLGALNAVSLVLREQRPEQFGRIAAMEDRMRPLITKMRPVYQSSLDQAVRFMEREEHRRALKALRCDWEEVMGRCCSSEAAEPYAVLGHGDCWNNNFLFRGQTSICILDWQISRLCSPALDISYFLLTSTEKPLRDQHYVELLHCYHQSFTDVATACGLKADELLSYEQLQQQLRQFGRYGVMMAPLLLMVIIPDAEHIMDLDEIVADMQRPDFDHGKELELTKFDERTLGLFRQRLGDVLDFAREWDWIE